MVFQAKSKASGSRFKDCYEKCSGSGSGLFGSAGSNKKPYPGTAAPWFECMVYLHHYIPKVPLTVFKYKKCN